MTQQESDKNLDEIEATQKNLRESIEESKRLAEKTQRLLKEVKDKDQPG